MATKIYINTTIFATAPWSAYDSNRNKLTVQVGGGDSNTNLNASALGQRRAGPARSQENNANLVITVNPTEFDDIQVSRWPQMTKNQLAKMIEDGLIVVQIGGVTQTATQVRTL